MEKIMDKDMESTICSSSFCNIPRGFLVKRGRFRRPM